MRLTRGEAWWLMRRREQMTQAAFAEAMKISEDRLRRWEKDRVASPLPSMCGRMRDPLSFGEFSALARRRAGRTLEEEARALRVSRLTLIKAEHDRTSFAYDLARTWSVSYPRAGAAAPVVVANPRGIVCRSTYGARSRARRP